MSGFAEFVSILSLGEGVSHHRRDRLDGGHALSAAAVCVPLRNNAGLARSERFKAMERRLLRAIINPAMIAVWILGLTLSFLPATDAWHHGWFHAKFALVVAMSGVHGMFASWVKVFARDANKRPARFYRIWNEVPTVLMIAIVILAVVKPF